MNLKVIELKNELMKRGIGTNGLKVDLHKKLMEVIENRVPLQED